MTRSLALFLFVLSGVLHAQETYWGMTANAGQNNAGTIYTMTSTGTFTKQYEFKLNEGSSLRSELMKATNGKYYGVTFGGGNQGNGTLFSYDPGTGTYTVLHNFSTANGTQPERGLMQASNGKLYGVCRAGGNNGLGSLYEFDPATNTFAKRHNFAAATGQTPRGRLVESGGKLWGVTQLGGTNSVGCIYEYDLASTTTTRRFNMTTALGNGPTTGMTLGANGLLYGVTYTGGLNSIGAIYSFNPVGYAYTRLYSFVAGITGNTPFAELVEVSPGVFYGTTTLGGANGTGGIFDWNINTSTYTPRVSFSSVNGQTCYSRMTLASNGLLYGMTSAGGTGGKGVVFSYDFNLSSYTPLLQLNPNNLGVPYAGLMEDPVGQLNGTCSELGGFGLGALFRYSIAGVSSTILASMGDSNGAYPWGRLTRASNGKFYGVTSGGGTSNSGVLFSYDPTTSTYTKLVDFSPTNGRYPFGKLTLVGNVLYGLCSQGGSSSGGTLFSYDIGTTVFTVLQNLTAATGTNPQAGMIQASNGQLYGSCSEGGVGFGTLFRYVIGTNTLTVVRNLTNADGSTPVADMMEASNGMLYGTLSEGGSFGSGSLYRIDPATNTFTRLVDFDATLGSGPSGELAEISGTLYGTTSSAALNSSGSVFSYVIATNTPTNVHDLTTAQGSACESGLLLGSDGKLYGACSSGGNASLQGTVFRYDPVADAVNVLRTLAVTDGVYPHDGLVKETIPPAPGIQVSVKAFLEGPYVQATNLMKDSLRTLGFVPLGEPYTALGFAQAGGGGGETTTAPVLAVTGSNAIVDWIRLELRSAGDPTSVVATKQCLIQRDGDIVGTDGVSSVSFTLAAGSYYVAVRHRNHLSVMTSAAVALGASPVTVDFTLPATTTYGTNARKTVGTAAVLWAGNVLRDSPAPFVLKYTGASNDRDPILSAIGGVVPTNTVTGYGSTDVNMDGTTKYTGLANDRDVILSNIGGVVPTNTRTDQLP